jgi:hypothetical protein
MWLLFWQASIWTQSEFSLPDNEEVLRWKFLFCSITSPLSSVRRVNVVCHNLAISWRLNPALIIWFSFCVCFIWLSKELGLVLNGEMKLEWGPAGRLQKVHSSMTPRDLSEWDHSIPDPEWLPAASTSTPSVQYHYSSPISSYQFPCACYFQSRPILNTSLFLLI